METLTNYLNIAGIFINSNLEIILNILFMILFTLILIWDWKLFNKVLKQRNKYSIKNFGLNLVNKILIELLQEKDEQIKNLKSQVKKLKNQKRVEKYYLEKRFLALDIAARSFFSRGAYKTLKRRYYLYNKKKLSTLENIEKEMKKNLKKTNK